MKKNRKTCNQCGKEQALSNYYSSNSPLHQYDKRVPYCKKCLRGMVDTEDIDTVYATLRSIDKPFLKEIWVKAGHSENNHFGEYARMICSLHQYRDLTWEDSILYDDNESERTKGTDDKINRVDDIDEVETESGVIKVTKELKSKWGNYTNREIIEMEKLYLEMERANDISTPQHRRQLLTYCKLSILMDKALDENDFTGFEKLSRQFDNLTKSSGFRPIDKKDGSEASGIRSFSQVYAEIEKDGFIEPYPIQERQDIVDRTIQYMLNYQLKLLNREQLLEVPDDAPKLTEEELLEVEVNE